MNRTDTITIKQDISLTRIRDLLVGAFEGGSNYWYFIEDYKLAPGLTLDDFRTGGKMQLEGEDWMKEYLIPFTPGCSLVIIDHDTVEEGEEDQKENQHLLNLESIREGLQVMAEKFPRHFGDFLGEDGDAITADVFLQCCLFGDAIYG